MSTNASPLTVRDGPAAAVLLATAARGTTDSWSLGRPQGRKHLTSPPPCTGLFSADRYVVDCDQRTRCEQGPHQKRPSTGKAGRTERRHAQGCHHEG